MKPLSGSPIAVGPRGNTERLSVSVVIPTYNHAAHLGETLRSVFSQTLLPLEVVIVNDGSTDETAAVVEEWMQKYPIAYVEQENRGQAAARNRGIEMARGDLVALLDDDDLWPGDKLEWQVRAFQGDDKTILVYGGMDNFTHVPSLSEPANAVEVLPSGDVRKAFARRNWIVSPGQTLIRRSVLLEEGGFDETIWGADDYDLYVRLSKIGHFRFEPKVALYYRRHAFNASHNVERMYRNTKAVLDKNWGKFPRWSNLFPFLCARWYWNRYFFERLIRQSIEQEKSGDTPAAISSMLRAGRTFPVGILRRSYLSRIAKHFINLPRRSEGNSPKGA